MEFQPVKGTRDFYPAEMALRNWIVEAWRRVSVRNGFVEYDGPEMEYLDLYRVKSGDEIVSQLFNFEDRGGRQLALRPELTPTLARMVNARVNALPRPIKWFSVPRLFRAENPQKGRLREFFQWNIDIIGSDDVLTDAECIFTCVDLLRELGLSESDAVVRYSSRRLLAEILRNLGLPDAAVPAVLAALDKRNKVPPEAFAEMLDKAVPDAAARAGVDRFLQIADPTTQSVAEICQAVGVTETPDLASAVANLCDFRAALEPFGLGTWCQYDSGVVRGLAYYTGIVYEVFDKAGELRAVAGGGRYDNLLEVLGGPKVGATGFGMGDAVLGILLEEKGRLPADLGKPRLDCFALAAEESARDAMLGLVAGLRRQNIVADFTPKTGNVGKLLKDANRRGARYALIVRPDIVGVKDLSTGQQTDVPIEQFRAQPRDYIK